MSRSKRSKIMSMPHVPTTCAGTAGASHDFNEAAAADWGFNSFMTNAELHDPHLGWISETEELVVQVSVWGEVRGQA